MTDEQMNDYHSDKCDYRNGTNEDGIYYDSCYECYRYDTCKLAFENRKTTKTCEKRARKINVGEGYETMTDKEIGKIIKQIIANYIFSDKADDDQCAKWREILEKVDEKFGLEHDEIF